ncbi:unnamed protein product [Prorocentrum cordatum]|uniref:Uncharacterized protein n=1 Tax=Prorocentrum cordatum TaxID=2364126 RepID=A0ABN9PG34_9DINO|nr:unnamed protein product [Polarella glacialis]
MGADRYVTDLTLGGGGERRKKRRRRRRRRRRSRPAGSLTLCLPLRRKALIVPVAPTSAPDSAENARAAAVMRLPPLVHDGRTGAPCGRCRVPQGGRGRRKPSQQKKTSPATRRREDAGGMSPGHSERSSYLDGRGRPPRSARSEGTRAPRGEGGGGGGAGGGHRARHRRKTPCVQQAREQCTLRKRGKAKRTPGSCTLQGSPPVLEGMASGPWPQKCETEADSLRWQQNAWVVQSGSGTRNLA